MQLQHPTHFKSSRALKSHILDSVGAMYIQSVRTRGMISRDTARPALWNKSRIRSKVTRFHREIGGCKTESVHM